jgi:hypothetical protein
MTTRLAIHESDIFFGGIQRGLPILVKNIAILGYFINIK